MPNPEAICALSPSVDAPYLAYPSLLPSSSLAAACTSSNSTSSGAASATSTSSSNSNANLDAGTGWGDMMLFSTPALAPANVVRAHRSPLTIMALSANGNLLATTSRKGTVIRVFATPSLDKLYQFRHDAHLLPRIQRRRHPPRSGERTRDGALGAGREASNGNGNGNAHSPAKSTDGHTDAGYEPFVAGRNGAGPFHMYSIPRDHIADDGNSSPPTYAFCLPGHKSLLTTSTTCLCSAMSFYMTEIGSYSLGSYKLAFVDEMPTQRFDSSTFWLLTVDLLHAEDTIEQALETRHALSHALACQWMGISIQPKFFSDTWLVNGLALSTWKFGFSASFNRKKMAVEITMWQEGPAYQMLEGNEHALALLKPVRIFEGQMTVRIHEADGTPYEHVLDIQAPFKRCWVPFGVECGRVGRDTKRYLAWRAAAQAAEEDTEAVEAMGMLEDWIEEDETAMSGATYEWIHMDTDFEWIVDLKFEQQDFMWVSQLQRDRDLVAQLEVWSAQCAACSGTVTHENCVKYLEQDGVGVYYFRIRCEAAVALVHCSIPRLDYLGLFHLFKLFLRYCYDPEDPNQDLFAHTYVPKPNDFSDLSEYFVHKASSPLALIIAISRTRYPSGKSPSIVRKFLIDQLRYNDNMSNAAKSFYICTICTILSLAAYTTISTVSPECGELLPLEVRTEYNEEDADLLKQSFSEMDRYRAMDRLIPSTHNNITIASYGFERHPKRTDSVFPADTKVAALHVEFALESGIMMVFEVNGAAGEPVVGVDVVHDDEIKAVKIRTNHSREAIWGEDRNFSSAHVAASLISVLILSWHRRRYTYPQTSTARATVAGPGTRIAL
ncbi:hypothetical protein DFH08DRAFT_1025072 [Mycena albidolilacea]|uniref:Uncharacterized protein n=1 Tax=Mycena albidolilacea TaxID=1033008 RepID=A0AAD7F0N3_9AGAR|nr:hypothetical protein DFH08DRAFT_1025072 [Mycena albidolilacea]